MAIISLIIGTNINGKVIAHTGNFNLSKFGYLQKYC